MFKVKLLKPPRKVEDSLARMGVVPDDTQTLFTSVVLIHDKHTNTSYIAHFKEALALIHNTPDFIMDDESKAVLNNVTIMLQNWGFIEATDLQLKYNSVYKVKVLKKIDLENGWVVNHKFKMTLPKLQRLITLMGS
jgi:hypothetical protein